jgi:hypothetical protein
MNTSLINTSEVIKNAPSLRDTIIFVRLTVHCWGAKSYDVAVTNKIKQQFGTTGKVGKFYKDLLDSPELRDYKSSCSTLTDWNKSVTAPWGDGGTRALNQMIFMEWRENFNHLNEDVNDAKREIILYYDQRKAEAQIRLKGMFREQDYPADISDKFGVTHELWPAADVSDWRLDFGDEANKELVDTVANQMNDRFSSIVTDSWGRIQTVLEHYVDRLEDPGNKFHDTMVEKMQDCVDILPCLNFFNDPELTKFTDNMKLKLYMHKPDTLRHDPGIRQNVHDEAKAMLTKVPGYTNGLDTDDGESDSDSDD